MYPIDSRSLKALRNHRWDGVGRNVFFLGATSLLTDISAEMVSSILPIYVVIALQLTPLQYGFIDGIYQGAAALAALAGGWFADRWRRHRDVAATGYALSAVCKLGLLAAGNAWGMLSTVIAIDRVGKGIRTAPRDAIISLSSAPHRLGFAFGVHRAFDTAGALLGPLAAFAILSLMPGAYDVIFVSSFFIAVIGVATITLLVREARPAPTTEAGSTPLPPLRFPAGALGLFKSRGFTRVVMAGCALGLVTVADSFFYLKLQRVMQITPGSFPLLYGATAVTYLLLAIPAGKLSDRFGRGRVFLFGHAVLLCAYATLLMAGSSRAVGLFALGLLGVYYACTDGVLMATASAHVPAQLRSSGLAVLATASGVSRMLASFLFGAAWNLWGIDVALIVFTVALALVLPLASRWLFRLESSH